MVRVEVAVPCAECDLLGFGRVGGESWCCGVWPARGVGCSGVIILLRGGGEFDVLPCGVPVVIGCRFGGEVWSRSVLAGCGVLITIPADVLGWALCMFTSAKSVDIVGGRGFLLVIFSFLLAAFPRVSAGDGFFSAGM